MPADAPPVSKNTKTAAGTAAAVAAALAIAVPALKTDEGKRNVDYLDIAKVPTACYGHTGRDVVVGQRRTDAQCEALLTNDAKAHISGLLVCTPTLIDHPQQLAAATRLTFNIGVGAYCRSTVARRFNAGDLHGGCDAFLAWDKARVNGVVRAVGGLTRRRQSERAMCLKGLR